MRASVEYVLDDCLQLTDIVVELVPRVYFFLLAGDDISQKCTRRGSYLLNSDSFFLPILFFFEYVRNKFLNIAFNLL